MLAIIFKQSCFLVLSSTYIETVFQDGTRCPADLSVATPETLVNAWDLGYRGDTRRMHVEHELLHTLSAEAKGLSLSPTLWNVAHPGTVPNAARADEEWLVFALQRYARKRTWDPKLAEIPDLLKLMESLESYSLLVRTVLAKME